MPVVVDVLTVVVRRCIGLVLLGVRNRRHDVESLSFTVVSCTRMVVWSSDGG